VKTIFLYLFRECLYFFALCLAAFTGVLFTLRILKFSSLLINKGVGISQIGMIFVSIIPTFLEFALPLATLLGVMLAFARLSGDSELVVLRGCGVSLYQLLPPVITFGFLSFLAALFVSTTLKPWGFSTLSDTLFDIARSKSTAGLDARAFNKVGTITLYAEYINDVTGQLRGVMVDDKRTADERKIIFAASGSILSDGESRTITFVLRNGTIHEMVRETYLATQFDQNSLVLSPEDMYDPDVMQKGRTPREMYLSELRTFITSLRDLQTQIVSNHGNPVTGAAIPQMVKPLFSSDQIDKGMVTKKLRRLRVEVQSRYAMPITSLILALLALPLGVQQARAQRTWGASISVLLGIGVFVIYYGFLSIGITMVESGKVPAFFGVWLPNFFSLGLALFFLRKLGSEQWATAATVVDILSDKMRLWYSYVAGWRHSRPHRSH
jgi:lipopolysaccharide export system permease protein